MTTNNPVVEAYATHHDEPMLFPSKGEADGEEPVSLVRLSDYEALQAECEKLRKDAERYRHIRGGNQWVVAATQTGFHVDGEHLDELIDSEMEQ